MNLIEAVEKEKSAQGLNDAQLCRLLHIDQSMWSRIKRGEYQPTKKFLTAVMRHLPELALAVIDYMRGDSRKATTINDRQI